MGHRVVTKPFPDATIRDMPSHVVPTIEPPDQVCLHAGTNDLKSSTSSDAADGIIDLAIEDGNDSESEIFISELTARNDDYCDFVKAVNICVKNFASKITGNSSAMLTSVQKDLTKVTFTSVGKVTSYCNRTL